MPAATEPAASTGADAVLAGLDPEQRAAAQAVRGPVCILAGAGTGKTRAITHRIAYSVRTGAVPPGQLLAVIGRVVRCYAPSWRAGPVR